MTSAYATEVVSVDRRKLYSSVLRPDLRYRPVGVAEDLNSGQERVVYRCLGTGKLVICTLASWHANFREES